VPSRDEFERAIRAYWDVREEQQHKSGEANVGHRGAVTGGQQMEAITQLIEDIFIRAGMLPESVHRSQALELPGYFRPEKKWDLLVVHEGSLIAAIELKSQVGPSFGNNFNNRTEEAIGVATDLWTAYREGRFGRIRPWLGYFFLLEAAEGSLRPVKVREPHFPVDRVFQGASYVMRYEQFCRRLVLERLYDAACLVTAARDPVLGIHEPSDDLNFTSFAAAISGRVASVLEQ
jgi:hypothetical protein